MSAMPRLTAVVRRLPLTSGLVGVIILVAIVTRALWDPLAARPLSASTMYGLPAFESGSWWTVVTGAFVAAQPYQYLPILLGLMLFGGFAEWRLGTLRYAIALVSCHVLAVVGTAGLLWLTRGHGYLWSTTLALRPRRRTLRRLPRRGRGGVRDPDASMARSPAGWPRGVRGALRDPHGFARRSRARHRCGVRSGPGSAHVRAGPEPDLPAADPPRLPVARLRLLRHRRRRGPHPDPSRRRRGRSPRTLSAAASGAGARRPQPRGRLDPGHPVVLAGAVALQGASPCVALGGRTARPGHRPSSRQTSSTSSWSASRGCSWRPGNSSGTPLASPCSSWAVARSATRRRGGPGAPRATSSLPRVRTSVRRPRRCCVRRARSTGWPG